MVLLEIHFALLFLQPLRFPSCYARSDLSKCMYLILPFDVVNFVSVCGNSMLLLCKKGFNYLVYLDCTTSTPGLHLQNCPRVL